MVTTGAVLRGDRDRLIGFDPQEQPVALQLGGSDPKTLAQCTRIAADFGYVEVNLNVGCPSDRVQEGRFGACLMAEPALVGECVAAMKAAATLPITVKCRIGIDDQDPEHALETMATTMEQAGVAALIVHARKAWLSGLSPRENRDIPPLDYELVYRLKAGHPRLPVVINGGIATLEAARDHHEHVDGVMMGRAAYQEPWRLLVVDPLLFGDAAPHTSMKQAVTALYPYIERQLQRGARLHSITRHLLGAFHAVPGARAYRRHLATQAVKLNAGVAVLAEGLAMVLDSPAGLAHTAAA
jgi:tRNA-dihydrouridine synthase A